MRARIGRISTSDAAIALHGDGLRHLIGARQIQSHLAARTETRIEAAIAVVARDRDVVVAAVVGTTTSPPTAGSAVLIRPLGATARSPLISVARRDTLALARTSELEQRVHSQPYKNLIIR